MVAASQLRAFYYDVMEIRVLGPADADALRTVDPDTFDDPLDPLALAEFLSDLRHHLVVAVEANVVVGFVSAVHYVHPDKPSPELWINEVGVAGSHRGRGVGKTMMARMLEHARTLGCSEAWVLTDEDNEAARRLYASQGGAESTGHVMYTFTFP